MMRRIVDSPVVAIALILALGSLYALVARFTLHGFPFSGDEYSTALQSELFAHGMLRAPGPEHAEWLRVDHVVIDNWVRTKYTPGASLLMAPGQWIGAPWLVTPIEATVTLGIVWHTVRRLFGAPAGLTAIILLGASPLFISTAASFYSHTPSLMLLSAAFSAMTSWLITQRDRWLIITGIAIGCAFLIRPFDAVLFGFAMTSLRSWRALFITAAAVLPFLAINGLYQYVQFGSPFLSGYAVYEPMYRAIYGESGKSLGLDMFLSTYQQNNHLAILKETFVGATVLGAPFLAIVGARRSENAVENSIRTFSVALIVIFVLALLFTAAGVDDGPRARYMTITLLPLSVLGASGLKAAWTAVSPRIAAAVTALAAVVCLWFTARSAREYLEGHDYAIRQRSGLYTSVAKANLPSNAVVMVRSRFPTRYARNGPFFDGILYLALPSDVSLEEVRAAFPGRPLFLAQEGRGSWRLGPR